MQCENLSKRNRAGFTMVEILSVIVIISILGGIVLGIASFATKKTDMAKARADMEKIKYALDEFRAEYGYYPMHYNGMANQYVGSYNITKDNRELMFNLWCKPQDDGMKPFIEMDNYSSYVNSGSWTNVSAYRDPWGRAYRYLKHPSSSSQTNAGQFGYDLWSEGANASEGFDDINNWSDSGL